MAEQREVAFKRRVRRCGAGGGLRWVHQEAANVYSGVARGVDRQARRALHWAIDIELEVPNAGRQRRIFENVEVPNDLAHTPARGRGSAFLGPGGFFPAGLA